LLSILSLANLLIGVATGKNQKNVDKKKKKTREGVSWLVRNHTEKGNLPENWRAATGNGRKKGRERTVGKIKEN